MSARGEGAGQPSTSAQGQPAAPVPQKRGRGRPRKQQQEPTCEPSPKRPRGRPKGSKNKSPSKAAQKGRVQNDLLERVMQFKTYKMKIHYQTKLNTWEKAFYLINEAVNTASNISAPTFITIPQIKGDVHKKAETIGEKRPRGRPRKWPQQVVQKKPAQETEETSSQESAEED